jgi:hypothetical protein
MDINARCFGKIQPDHKGTPLSGLSNTHSSEENHMHQLIADIIVWACALVFAVYAFINLS